MAKGMDYLKYRKGRFHDLFPQRLLAQLIKRYNYRQVKQASIIPLYPDLLTKLTIAHLCDLARDNQSLAAYLTHFLLGQMARAKQNATKNKIQVIENRALIEMDTLTPNDAAYILTLLFRSNFTLAITVYKELEDWHTYLRSSSLSNFFFFNQSYDFIFFYAEEINKACAQNKGERVHYTELVAVWHSLIKEKIAAKDLKLKDFFRSKATLYDHYNTAIEQLLAQKPCYWYIELLISEQKRHTAAAFEFLEKLKKHYLKAEPPIKNQLSATYTGTPSLGKSPAVKKNTTSYKQQISFLNDAAQAQSTRPTVSESLEELTVADDNRPFFKIEL